MSWRSPSVGDTPPPSPFFHRCSGEADHRYGCPRGIPLYVGPSPRRTPEMPLVRSSCPVARLPPHVSSAWAYQRRAGSDPAQAGGEKQ